MSGRKLNLKKGRWVRFKFNPFTESLPKELIGIEGNYAIIINGKINYIGQSVNIHTRLWIHQLAIGFSALSKMEIAIRVESKEEKQDIESHFINKFHPPANIQIPRRRRKNFKQKNDYEPDGLDKLTMRLIKELNS